MPNSTHEKVFIQALSSLKTLLRLYPTSHPSIQVGVQALFQASQRLLARDRHIRLGICHEVLCVNQQLFLEPNQAELEIFNLLSELGIELEIHAAVQADDLSCLVGYLTQPKTHATTVAQQLQQRHITSIRLFDIRAEDSDQDPSKVYRQALQIVDDIFRDVRLGRIPSLDSAKTVVRRLSELAMSTPQALLALALLKDYDNYTYTHSVNVGVLAIAVGRACGVSAEQLQSLGLGGLIHDIGKLTIPAEILNKPGKLTPQELDVIRRHPKAGAEIAKTKMQATKTVVDIIFGHHLGHDRRGYPADVPAFDEPDLVEMVAIADAYDAMTTLRPYQAQMTPRQAARRLRELAETSLNPKFVAQFLQELGVWPIGSCVRLVSNELAVVKAFDSATGDLELLRICDSTGRLLEVPEAQSLSRQQLSQIVAEIDPSKRCIDVAKLLLSSI